ncbi:dual 3',5'-cyclic-AMP and -GMP phosphodiesterase 11A isoform X1 [Hydra vulgaris]|uniref:dual 3',5'-cyclic-AMP and -GMP phosphodiesterase 11A isoform X1 n=2 Tax=Hydra vulgaris TaxID=6087 RepID=UPI001F5E6D06|nr:dual 3',5'-cyclic-AMP and -GMP phosphodiesterase 11A isoform X1 [Hydra vulgaris]
MNVKEEPSSVRDLAMITDHIPTMNFTSDTMPEVINNGFYKIENKISHYLNTNKEFTNQFVINYLHSNTEFAEQYFIKYASMDLIEKWYDVQMTDKIKGSRRKVSTNSINDFEGEVFPVSKVSLESNPELEIENNGSDSNKYPTSILRRKSEPYRPDVKMEYLNPSSNEDALNSNCLSPKLRVLSNKKHRTKSDDDIICDNQSNKKYEFIKDEETDSRCKTRNLLRFIQSSVYSGSASARLVNFENRMQKRQICEHDVMFDVLTDITTDLSLNRTCLKIVLNFGFLLNFDKASLYLVEKNESGNFLKQKIHNVNIDEHVGYESFSFPGLLEIPFGKGLIGQIAVLGESFICNDLSKCTQLDQLYDKWYDNQVKNVLIQPIIDNKNELTALIVGINHKSGGFTNDDQQAGIGFLSFCAVCINNAKLFELSKQEFDRNKSLLELAHCVFEEQISLTDLSQKILDKATTMFQCKKSSLMLIEDPKETDEIFTQLFQLTATDNKEEYRYSKFQRDSIVFSSYFDPFFDTLADSVALKNRKNKRNILEATPISSVKPFTYQDGGNICIPIRNNIGQIIGVVKLCERKVSNFFTENDRKLIEGFAIFSGLGINNCIMYDKILKGKAQQTVAIEALSYHTNARQVDVDKLKLSIIPQCQALNLTSLSFDDFSLMEHEMLTASIRMFKEFGFLKKYQIEYEVLCRFLITVKNNYRRVIYHNWRHAFNVTQSMFAALTTGKMSEQFSSKECLALLVGCLCHDLDHRGTNNEFQMKTDSPLVKLYSTSTLEHHHFNRAVMILNSEGNNIFSRIPSEEYRKLMKLIKHAILATDLSNYIRQRDAFEVTVKGGLFDTNKYEHRSMLRSMLMTACDLNGITKPWEIQKRVVHLVTSEFFHQGDMERDKLHVEPKEMMDRNHVLQLPKLQAQFFQTMCIPIYKVLSDFNPLLLPLLKGAEENKVKWSDMNKKLEQGEISADAEPVLHPLIPDQDVF